MKKGSIISVLLITSLFMVNITHARNVYIGPMLLFQHIDAPHSHFNGIHPRLSLGFEDWIDGIDTEYYFAGELFVSPATATLSDLHDKGAISTKTTRSIGISILPGIKLDDGWIGYSRLGVINSTFSSPDVSKWGGQAGLGVQVCLTATLNLRVEYIFTAYQFVPGLHRPKSNEVGMGLTYRL